MTKKSAARKARDVAKKVQGSPEANVRQLQIQLMMSEQRLRAEMQTTTDTERQMAATRDQFLIWMSILIDKLGGKSVLITDKQYERAQKTWAGMDTNRLKTGMKFTLVTVEEVAENAQPEEGSADAEVEE